MGLLFKRRWVNVSIVGLVLFVAAAAILLRDRDLVKGPPGVREYAAVRADWDQALSDPESRVRTDSEKVARWQRFAERCLELAEEHPNSAVELAALQLAAGRASDTAQGARAGEILRTRIATADLGQLALAIWGFGLGPSPRVPGTAPLILDRVKQRPDHPEAAALLAHICSTLGWDSETENPPRHFAEAANLIVSRYADSPDIEHICETLGNGFGSPPWAGQFERHLRTILKVNKDRWVRCTASLALASVAQSSVDRQVEAEGLYEQFLAEFDGQSQYMAQNVEKEYYRRAELQLEAMRFTPIGRPAPEIVGVDLEGQPMKLSEHRGKVVLLSFWATWCFPCMKLIPHELELAARLEGEPFAIVGVNADTDDAAVAKAVAKHRITWRSFQDKRSDREAISDEWNALFPTLYLIDHDGIIHKRWTGSPPPEVLNRMVDDLVEAAQGAGGRPMYHEYPGVGHNCWDRTYANPELYEWLLLQKGP